jgi:nitrogen-specific signal transduction histidine kinase
MRSAATSADSAPGGLTATGLQAALGIGFERSAAPMLLVDDDLRVIIYANPAAHLMFAADSLVGRLLSEFSTSDRTSSDAWESAALDGRMN